MSIGQLLLGVPLSFAVPVTPPTSNILVQDNFAGANGVLLQSRASEVGGTPIKLATSTLNLQIVSPNKLRAENQLNKFGLCYWSVTAPALSSTYAKCLVSNLSRIGMTAGVGIIFPNSDYYVARFFSPTSGTLNVAILKSVSGTATAVSTFNVSAPSIGSDTALEMRWFPSISTLKVSWAGTEVINYQDTTSPLSGIQQGCVRLGTTGTGASDTNGQQLKTFEWGLL